MADYTLNAIRTKVRRLTRSPSIAQITDEQIDEYSLMGWGMSKNDLLKLSRMLKLNKIFRKNNKEKNES